MTGETENGRSISVVSSALPLNSNLAIAHAAAMPKTRLSGTAMAVTRRVSLIAAQASGSTSAARYSPAPLRKASTKTAMTGRMRNSARKASARAISVMRVPKLSVTALQLSRGAEGAGSFAMTIFPPCPCLDEIDEKQHRKGKRQHHRGKRGRPGIIIFLKLDDDQKRCDFRDIGRVARDEYDR